MKHEDDRENCGLNNSGNMDDGTSGDENMAQKCGDEMIAKSCADDNCGDEMMTKIGNCGDEMQLRIVKMVEDYEDYTFGDEKMTKIDNCGDKMMIKSSQDGREHCGAEMNCGADNCGNMNDGTSGDEIIAKEF